MLCLVLFPSADLLFVTPEPALVDVAPDLMGLFRSAILALIYFLVTIIPRSTSTCNIAGRGPVPLAAGAGSPASHRSATGGRLWWHLVTEVVDLDVSIFKVSRHLGELRSHLESG